MNATELRETAIVGIQKWDAKAATKKGYNPHALEIACQKLDEFIEWNETQTLKFAILKCFIGRLAVQVAKEFKITLTDNEIKFGVRGIDLLVEGL